MRKITTRSAPRMFLQIWMLCIVTTAVKADPSTFEIEKNIAARTDNANCVQLAQNMNESIKALNAASGASTAANVATAGGILLGFVPGAGVTGALLRGGGIMGRSSAVTSEIEPQVLYEQSFQLYEGKGCLPKAQFGEPISGEIKEGEELDESLMTDQTFSSCLSNWSETGAFTKGQQFKSFVHLNKNAKDKAFGALTRYLLSEGYSLGHTDAGMGLVTAIQPLRNSQLTMNYMFQDMPDEKIKLEAIVSVPAGFGVTSRDAKKGICDSFLKAAEN